MYSLLRALLFTLPPEQAHALTLSLLRSFPECCFLKPTSKPVQVLGFEFAHPVGLAAGFDKNGAYVDALAKLGFSFIEIGTVTPRPQSGNPKPRLFRLRKAQALINRLGFNNHGVDVLVNNLRNVSYQGVLGINIGKNKDTPLHQAIDDYTECLNKVYRDASYVTINVSSPNTPDLRQLQQGVYFKDLVLTLKKMQLQLADKYQRYVPLVIKVSPDESDESLKRIGEIVVSNKVDGIIATNTTCKRAAVSGLAHAHEPGGLSGPPLAKRATHCLRLLKQVMGDDVVLIGTGGIDSIQAGQEKLNAGASLLQIYTGLIYKGPGLVRQLITGLAC